MLRCCTLFTGEPDLDAINREFAFAAETDAKHAARGVLPAEDDSDLVL